MNPIKAFFEKKKLDSKFRKAGRGHKLNEEGSSSHSVSRPAQSSVKRHEPNEISRRAGEAALARLEQNQAPPVNWSLTAVRAQAKKELELELQAEQKAKTAPKEVYKDSCELLTVSGVYYTCPLIGPYVLAKSEIEAKIEEFLYNQLKKEEPGLTACLIIWSCNRDKEKAKLGVETLCKYLTNIIDNPSEEKYQKIRINNKIFQERVAPVIGAIEFLAAAGFEKKLIQGDNEEEFFVFSKDKSLDIENLQMLKEALLCAEPILPTLDRNVKVLMPLQATQKINLPDAFYKLSIEDLKKEQEMRVQTVELNTQLRTKAMRERDDIREMRKYRYTLIRIKFPDGIILQGTFKVREKLEAVKEFIIEHLADRSREFTLLAPGKIETESSLVELKLVPAAILNLLWVTDDDHKDIPYLKPETLCLLQNV